MYIEEEEVGSVGVQVQMEKEAAEVQQVADSCPAPVSPREGVEVKSGGVQVQMDKEVAEVQQVTDSCRAPVSPREGVEMQGKVYPAPLHSHEEVVGDRELFMDSLHQLHSAMGTKFMTPVIGGKDLDLHLLYVEVTQRGGLAKVIELKKWREVIAAFKFPPTTTSASFVLRRYYLSLLHHYEQVYFFRAQGPPVPPAASLQIKTPMAKLENGPIASDSTMQKPKSRKRSIPAEQPENKGQYNFTVTGSIDAKFEHGYMVTVIVGSETLRGVLYHASPQAAAAASSPSTPVKPEIADNGGIVQSRHGSRRVRRYDADHPKPCRSAYNFFFAEEHAKLKAMYPHREGEFSKMIGESWTKLSEEEKTVYLDLGLKDKERYERELQEYKDTTTPPQPEEGENSEGRDEHVKAET